MAGMLDNLSSGPPDHSLESVPSNAQEREREGENTMDKQPTIDGYTRQDLWDRLEQAKHFDWCRKEEYRRLRALFFDGVIEDAPDEYTREVELVWSPRTGSAHWQSVLDARCRFRDTDTGEIEYHPQWGEEYANERLNRLLIQRDQQHYGMAVADQIALIDFLGIRRMNPRLARAFLDAWLGETWVWLDGKPRRDHGMVLSDTRATRQRGLFYRLLSEAPIAFKGTRLVPTREAMGWEEHQVHYLHVGFKMLFEQLDHYRVPKKLPCDPARWLQFVEALRHDLDSNHAPQILREAWTLWSTRKARSRANAQARAAAKAAAAASTIEPQTDSTPS